LLRHGLNVLEISWKLRHTRRNGYQKIARANSIQSISICKPSSFKEWKSITNRKTICSSICCIFLKIVIDIWTIEWSLRVVLSFSIMWCLLRCIFFPTLKSCYLSLPCLENFLSKWLLIVWVFGFYAIVLNWLKRNISATHQGLILV